MATVQVTRDSVTENVQIAVGQSFSAARSSVAGATSATSLLGANAARLAASFFNESTAIAYLYVGSPGSTTDYTVQIPAGGYFELTPPACGAAIGAVWAAANGHMRVTEYT